MNFSNLYKQLKNNEYIDKDIITKISAITESNYIGLQNTNQNSKVEIQLQAIKNTHNIYGFLYEFKKKKIK